MNKNYQLETDNIINSLTNRPKLLLHSCCGPCSSYVLLYLSDYFDIDVYFYNPNVYPKDEYDKRLKEQIRLINSMDKKIGIIETLYDFDNYNNYIKGYENEKEGGLRCHLCYRFRMENACLYAKNNGYDYFTTTLSVSPYKNSKVLNEIGELLESKHGVKYLYSDFKKRNGYKMSIELSKKYNLYRQDYCGCKYSLK